MSLIGPIFTYKIDILLELFQAIPRMVWLDSNGKQVLQWSVEELETLRGNKVHISNQQVKKGEHVEIKGITAAQVCYLHCIFAQTSLVTQILP